MTTRIQLNNKSAAIQLAEALEEAEFEAVIITQQNEDGEEDYLVATPNSYQEITKKSPIAELLAHHSQITED